MKSYKNEDGYLELLKDVLENSYLEESRNGNIYTIFGATIYFEDINNNFPLITTKKIFLRGVIEELLWFLRGETDANILKSKKVNIWDLNSSRKYLDDIGLKEYEEGELGPIYGFQWRNYNGDYDLYKNNIKNGIDQIEYILKELIENPNSRRAVLSAWNPQQLNKMALPPCHILYNFYRNNKENSLSCMLYLRSNDLFLGQPFNIASVSVLLLIISSLLHLKADKICLSICNAHIYEEHKDAVLEQLKRKPFELPKLIIKKVIPNIETDIKEKIKWIENLKYEDFELINYNFYDAIKVNLL